jgi:hypothetical protein
VVSLEEREKDEQKPFLEQLLREGARKLLQAAIENEVTEYIQFHKDRRDEKWTAAGGTQWTSAGAGVGQWSGANPGSSATGPPSGQGAFYQSDSAQVHAAGSQHRCLASSHLHQRRSLAIAIERQIECGFLLAAVNAPHTYQRITRRIVLKS